MGVLEDVRKLLSEIPLWKELGTIPDRTKVLEGKIAALETMLNSKRPGDVCPFCGAQSFRLDRVDMHGQREIWKCTDAGCGKIREITHDLMQKNQRSGPTTWGKR
jgi:ribosomal protein L37AE/L43A